jgi:hypothetical protein
MEKWYKSVVKLPKRVDLVARRVDVSTQEPEIARRLDPSTRIDHRSRAIRGADRSQSTVRSGLIRGIRPHNPSPLARGGLVLPHITQITTAGRIIVAPKEPEIARAVRPSHRRVAGARIVRTAPYAHCAIDSSLPGRYISKGRSFPLGCRCRRSHNHRRPRSCPRYRSRRPILIVPLACCSPTPHPSCRRLRLGWPCFRQPPKSIRCLKE